MKRVHSSDVSGAHWHPHPLSDSGDAEFMPSHSSGVNVPGIRMVDAAEGVLGIEWIDGKSVRFLLGGGAEGEEEIVEDASDEFDEDVPLEPEEDPLQEYGVSQGERPSCPCHATARLT